MATIPHVGETTRMRMPERSNMSRIWMACGVLGVAFLASPIVGGEETPTPPTIKEVMKEAHKKPKDLLRKVAVGNSATPEDKQRLLELYQALAKNTPPKGAAGSWKEKVELLVNAAQAVVDGQPDAVNQLTKAANCTACHAEHK